MKLGERHWPEVRELVSKVAVVPIASCEQHGHHLPLLTDTIIGAEIARRAEEALGDEALFLPILWVGASDHHSAFRGTISLHNSTYVRVLVDIIESLIGGGFRRILLLNSHGGNILPGRMAIYDVQLRHRDRSDLWLALGSWWDVAAPEIAALNDIEQEKVTHACEQETSMVLRLRPELVRMDLARGANIPFESRFYVPDFARASRVDVARTFDQLSETGAFGHPEISTAEKGESLYRTASEQVVELIRDFARWPEVLPPH